MTSINLNSVDEVSLIYVSRTSHTDRPVISNSYDAARVLRNNWSQQIALWEEFKILLLDNGNRVLGLSTLSKGGLTCTVVDVRLAFMTALKAKVTGLILCHNHPSCNPRPSEADKVLTQKFYESGKLLDIKILDHIILMPHDGHYSFRDELNILM